MTIFELMNQLSAFDADSIDMAAKATVQAGIPVTIDKQLKRSSKGYKLIILLLMR